MLATANLAGSQQIGIGPDPIQPSVGAEIAELRGVFEPGCWVAVVGPREADCADFIRSGSSWWSRRCADPCKELTQIAQRVCYG